MAGTGISVGGFLRASLLAAGVLVFATYNPTGYSFAHWSRQTGGAPAPAERSSPGSFSRRAGSSA
ncbi:MAG: hypothetical protein IPF66_10775 [Holophagales bacterium]|nr:hypothetical protein [Holophagales bacterium]